MKSQYLLAIFAILALATQSVAYSIMACEMHGGSEQSHVHSTHHEKQTSAEHHDHHHDKHASSAHDCQTHCVCPVNSCSSLVYLSAEPESLVHSQHHLPRIEYRSLQQEQLIPVLFRPPIIA